MIWTILYAACALVTWISMSWALRREPGFGVPLIALNLWAATLFWWLILPCYLLYLAIKRYG